MDQTTLKIAIAAFFHDIGKFCGKNELGLTQEDLAEYDMQLYLPSYKGRFSHYHALYTAEFIKRYKSDLPLELNSAAWGEDDIFVNLAAGHHNPGSPLQWVIAVSDRVSSGWDRDEYEDDEQKTEWKDYKKTRLAPVFEELSVQGKNTQHLNYHYSLAPVSLKTIFPVSKKDAAAENNEQAAEAYMDLFKGFTAGLKNLSHRLENIALWFEHFESLFMLYASHIPAARAGDVVPDVSLYDHARTTAALATAIFHYHRANNTLTIEAVKNYNDNKFLLINGDFAGVQDFIFSKLNSSNKFRSKLLRGRSLSVSLITELAADMLCRRTGLPSTSIVLNAAGKFTVIAANTDDTAKAVASAKDRINSWLIQIGFGEIRVNISTCEASCNDFTRENFVKLWERLSSLMEKEKFSGFDLDRHGGSFDSYLDSFENVSGHPAVCSLCGKRPALKDGGKYLRDSGTACCRLCRDHIFLGTNIVKKSRLLVTTIDADVGGPEEKLMEPVFGEYQICFLKEDASRLAESGQLLKDWNVDSGPESMLKSPVAVKCISGYVPRYTAADEHDERILSLRKSDKKNIEAIEQILEGEPRSLNFIASMAKTVIDSGKQRGVEALGVLKADVDYLGLLMTHGLPARRFTISRLATLSRQLNYFFAVFLPELLKTDERFQNVYTVFAGGDDLFLIGPWNKIVELSLFLTGCFTDYVAHNKEVHFSAGISIHKPQTPINAMAVAAEKALEKSKSDGRNRLTVFDVSLTWDEVRQLVEVEKALEEWLDKNFISRVMFYKINEFINMAAREKQVVKDSDICLADMDCTRWRSLLVYSAERNIGTGYKKQERKKAAEEVTTRLTGWLERFESKLRIPLWKILYNKR